MSMKTNSHKLQLMKASLFVDEEYDNKSGEFSLQFYSILWNFIEFFLSFQQLFRNDAVAEIVQTKLSQAKDNLIFRCHRIQYDQKKYQARAQLTHQHTVQQFCQDVILS